MSDQPAPQQVVFTICSNNYIYKARVLAESVQALGTVPVFLFLADAPVTEIGYEELNFVKVVFLEELGIPNLEWMKIHYSVVEMNTAIKAFAFRYLLSHTTAQDIYFFDPDVKLYQPLSSFYEFWGDSFILLTPHILSPIPLDGKFPAENLFSNHGIYNLGFIALRRSKTAETFLNWWSERMLQKCIIDLKEGYFVDQLPMNLVPAFFEKVNIITHPGCNMAYWNLHERQLRQTEGNFMVNGDDYALIFYHFSGFNPLLTYIHNSSDFRYSFEDLPVLKMLYSDYLASINRFDPPSYGGYIYFNGQYPVVEPPPGIFSRISRKLKGLFIHG